MSTCKKSEPLRLPVLQSITPHDFALNRDEVWLAG
jgi:hypothetical protein